MTLAQRPNQMRGGRFTVLRPLSKGGMGALYLASETIATGARQVVIKEMLDYYDSNDPQGQVKAQRRFEAEAVTLARLSIPGIPQVFDYFSEGGRNYIVMQFIEGKNLENGLSHLDELGASVKGKSYPVEQVQRWGSSICRMLENLASQNVIHMDIKPANLIVDQAGTVWLVDFGTSKESRVPAGRGQAGSMGVSQGQVGAVTGLKKSSIYGTLGYAAPEQVSGKPESRSDVFALAATLYHLATDDDPGRHPTRFPGLDGLPVDFRNALKRALVLDVRQRINAREFSEALEPRGATRSLGFHWQDGAVSQEPADLASAADLRWEEARGYFKGSSWENWLQDIHRNDLALKIGKIKKQYQNLDLGLDAFLRVLNPGLARAQLRASPGVFDAGVIPWGTQREIFLELHNTGGGALFARVGNLPTGIKSAEPDALAVHRRQTFKLVVDSAALKPSSNAQTLPVVINAGDAGHVRVQIRLVVPIPQMEIEPGILDLGVVFRGQIIDGALAVRNKGSSPFRCEVACQMPGLIAAPGRFTCDPGCEKRISFQLDTRQFRLGLHASTVRLRAWAGSWEQVEVVKTQVVVSIMQTLWNYGGPILAWATGCGIYGGFLGWFLASLAFGITGEISTALLGGIIGGFLGMLVCLFPALVLGVIGWLGEAPGRAGLRWGAVIGCASGVVMGGVVGSLAGWFGVSAAVFGALVGGISAAVLGILLQQQLQP